MRILPRLEWRSNAQLKAQALPAILEAFGIGMIVGGLWFLNPVVSMIVLGVIFVVIAQGFAAERND